MMRMLAAHLPTTLHPAWPLAVVGFVTGALWVQFQASLPSASDLLPWLITALLLMVCACVFSAQLYDKQISRRTCMAVLLWNAVAGVALGGTWAATIGAQRVADGWPSAYEGIDVIATGYVANMPSLGTQSQRMQFVIEGNDVDTALNGKTVLLSWYYGSFIMQPAQRYRLTFRAKQRHGGLNPGGFDYELWLVSRGIAATGYIRDKANAPLDLDTQTASFLPQVERIRARVRERLFATAPTPDGARWAAALALGDQRSLSDVDWQRYNATGTGHLLAVSGTHITLIAALLAWLAARWWQSKPQRLLRLPVQTLRLNVMLVSSGIYALIAGWALPAQRTVLMLAVVWWSLRLMARPAAWHVMASSAAVALVFDPMAVISPSFWLSYGAVAVLIAIELRASVSQILSNPEQAPTVKKSDWQIKWNVIKNAARSQLLLTLALVPLGAVFFNQISVVSPLANAVAIPIMGWVSTPLALLAALLSLLWGGMAAAFMQALLAVQHGVDWVLDALLWLPYSQLRVPTTPLLWAAFGLLCAVGCALLHKIWRVISMTGVLVYVVGAFVFANFYNAPNDAQLSWRVVFLDVGQGSAVAVHSQGKTLLFDAGPRYSADSDGAARVIVPYLHAAGVQRIDHVILSHADEDHTGGTRSLLARMAIGQWWHSLSAVHPLLRALPTTQLPCEAGKRLQWAGLQLHWLHPPAAINHNDHKTNAVSCVLRISDTASGGKTTVLLTGDIEAQQEAELIARNASDLAAQIVMAPHHGSKTSSTPAFLQAVNPLHVVMQNGYRNRYGHPHPNVSQRYLDAGITQWRSDLDGAVVLDVQSDGFNLFSWRTQAQRYWHTALPAEAILRAVADGREF